MDTFAEISAFGFGILFTLPLLVLIIGLLVVLARSVNIRKKMSKNDLDSVLEASAAEAEKATEKALNEVAGHLSSDFETTLNTMIKKDLAKFDERFNASLNGVVDQSTEMLTTLKGQSKTKLQDAGNQITANSDNLKKEVVAATEAQKQIVIGKVQARFNDILAAYITQILAGSIDITSQQEFIMSRLESTKQDLIEELKSVSV